MAVMITENQRLKLKKRLEKRPLVLRHAAGAKHSQYLLYEDVMVAGDISS